jgi:hypothetical protein
VLREVCIVIDFSVLFSTISTDAAVIVASRFTNRLLSGIGVFNPAMGMIPVESSTMSSSIAVRLLLITKGPWSDMMSLLDHRELMP